MHRATGRFIWAAIAYEWNRHMPTPASTITIAEYIARLVAVAPPLTAEQESVLRAVLS